MNSKGDLIIEYSYNQYRLFFGFKNNGKFYFPEITKEMELQSNIINQTSIRRYESINSFISLINDPNKQKEYLLSISSYITVLELYDFENDNDSYNITESVNFFDNSLGIYAYTFQILEAKIENDIFYFCIYIILTGNGGMNYMYIKKFGFSNFNFEVVRVKIYGISNDNYINGRRIVSSIIIDYYKVIAIFYYYSGEYVSSLYNYDLQQILDIYRIACGGSLIIADGIFFKSIYLYNEYVAFLYFKDKYNIRLKILYLSDSLIFSTKFDHLINYYY